MSNEDIIERLEDAVELMELTDVNVFKINAYRKLIQSLESDGRQIQNMNPAELGNLFSKGMAATLREILETGTFGELTNLEKEIPAGVRTMLRINGIGPKKIRTLWKDAGIDSIEGLKSACQLNQVSQLKGFGEKIQQSILQGITFLESVVGRLLLHKADAWAEKLEKQWADSGIGSGLRTGQFQTRPETISSLDFIFPVNERNALKNWSEAHPEWESIPEKSGPFHLRFRHLENFAELSLYFAHSEDLERSRLMLESESRHWLQARDCGIPLYPEWKKGLPTSAVYSSLGKPEIPAELRNGTFEWRDDLEEKLHKLVQYQDVKGCLHNHSKWSDGKNSIQEMADWCIQAGWTYFGLADHSKSAGYANGLQEDSLYSQWIEIDELNKGFGGKFRILKGIESDILGDGNLDYPHEILSKFDFVVASVHSLMKMDIKTATSRLIKAIENPFTRILGHCSGRILLRRSGYPLDYTKVIDACIANHVAIELNAHPSRLDMDFIHLQNALEKGAMISVNPDAHEDSGMAFTRYGITMARKAGAEKQQVLNCLPLGEVLSFFNHKK